MWLQVEAREATPKVSPVPVEDKTVTETTLGKKSLDLDVEQGDDTEDVIEAEDKETTPLCPARAVTSLRNTPPIGKEIGSYAAVLL